MSIPTPSPFPIPALHPSVAGALAGQERPVVVIGGGGWMGQAVLHMIGGSAESGDLLSRVHVFGSAARTMRLPGGRSVAVRPLSELGGLRVEAPLVFHLAFLTKDKVDGLSPDAYERGNTAITDAVAGWLETVHPAGLVLPSSGAVYGAMGNAAGANPYGALKLKDEERFAALAARRGFRVAIGRVFNLSGPFMNKLSLYALGSILAALIDGRPVVLRAPHHVVRAYTHVGDALNLMITEALEPGAGASLFDVAGLEPVEVGELARRCAALLGRADIPIERPPHDPEREDRYLGDPAPWRRLADRHGIALRPLDAQILDTAAYVAALPPDERRAA